MFKQGKFTDDFRESKATNIQKYPKKKRNQKNKVKRSHGCSKRESSEKLYSMYGTFKVDFLKFDYPACTNNRHYRNIQRRTADDNSFTIFNCYDSQTIK